MTASEIETRPILKFDNLVVAPRGISEVCAGKVMVFVPTSEIGRVTLKFGRSDNRPTLTLAMGLGLAAAGVAGLFEFAIAPGGYRYELGLVALGAVGGSLIFDTLKKRFFLEIQKKRGVCRLVLSKNTRKAAVQEFCRQIRTVYQYEITILE